MHIIRTDSENPDFKSLVIALDAYLKITDGDEHDFYNQFNNIDVIKHTVVAFENDRAVGCGAFKKFDDDSVEIKRMFTKPELRESGVATTILLELETWAKELGFESAVLETGTQQIEAVKFYRKNGYNVIPNYGQYENVLNSLCFKKVLS
jgi:GNAT superfamily N-acetyltransferase